MRKCWNRIDDNVTKMQQWSGSYLLELLSVREIPSADLAGNMLHFITVSGKVFFVNCNLAVTA